MTIIDFHNHFYPQQYIEALQSGPSNIKVSFDSENNPLLHYPGDYNIIVREHTDIDFRAKVLKEAGVDKQILTFTTPGTHIEPPERSVELAQMVNDSFAQIMVYSNINGTALSDQSFWPLYEKANDLNAVFYIHPSFPVGVEAMTDYWLMPLIGFTFDTTLAAAKLVFSGVAEKFPKIRWVLAHLGGAIPYLAERLDRGYFAFKNCRENIDKPPSEYLKDFYYDTVNFDLKALQLAIDFSGVGHLVAGSDYPHQIGSLEKMVDSIDKLNISSKDKEAIYGENSIKLLEIIQ